jgi:hypothetical protein
MTSLVSYGRRGGLASGAKSINGTVQRKIGKRVVRFSSVMATQSTLDTIYYVKVSAPKTNLCEGSPHAFRNPLRPIPNLTTCPSSPGAREPISVAIPFAHLRKNGAIMQKVNVSHGESKMDNS